MSSSPPLHSMTEPDTDRAPSLIAIYTAQCGISLVFLVLRFWSRLLFGGIGSDDATMVFSWIIYAILTVLVALMAANGAMRHAYYLNQQQASLILKLNYVTRPFGIFAVVLVKIAVGLLILRVLRRSTSKGIKYFLWIILALNTLIGTLDSIFTFVQCNPPAALWEPSLKATAHCWDPSIKNDFGTFSASLNVAVDLILAVVPAIIIWRLHMSFRKRLSLIVLFGCSILSVVSAAIKTYQLSQPVTPDSDPTWSAYSLYAWTSSEVFVLHFCASIPTLKPLWDKYMLKKRNTNFSTPRYKLSSLDHQSGTTTWATTTNGADRQEYGLQQPIASSSDCAAPSGVPENSIYVTRSINVNEDCCKT
ncbi:hypothetical protein F4779DRAFT_585495 [Xylariaceae sp. FL0662B]|nr:hypothetical protein F4779DRAFT_585495 [Xylariaceae sp. FL0662B]